MLKTFYLVDLDRTTFHTVEGSRLLVEICRSFDPALADTIEQEVREHSYFGASYSARDAIRRYAGADVAASVEAQFIEQAQTGRSLRLPGAQALIDWIEAQPSVGWGILTYGVLENQHMKLRAIGLDKAQVIVTDEPHKGTLIASWWDADIAQFRLPSAYGGGSAEEIVLIDDRVGSFEGLPLQARGYWVTKEAVDALDAIPVPERVVAVPGLVDVIQEES